MKSWTSKLRQSFVHSLMSVSTNHRAAIVAQQRGSVSGDITLLSILSGN